jgi:hypothetical protein
MFSAGFVIGTLVASAEDVYGRIVFMRVGMFLAFFGSTFGCLMPEIYSYCIFPAIAGCGVGLYEVAAVTYCTEINKV